MIRESENKDKNKTRKLKKKANRHETLGNVKKKKKQALGNSTVELHREQYKKKKAKNKITTSNTMRTLVNRTRENRRLPKTDSERERK